MSQRECGNAFLDGTVLVVWDSGWRCWRSRRQRLLLSLKSQGLRRPRLRLWLQISLPWKNLKSRFLCAKSGRGVRLFATFAALDRFFLGGFVGAGGFIVSLLLTDFKFASAFIVALSFSDVEASCA